MSNVFSFRHPMLCQVWYLWVTWSIHLLAVIYRAERLLLNSRGTQKLLGTRVCLHSRRTCGNSDFLSTQGKVHSYEVPPAQLKNERTSTLGNLHMIHIMQNVIDGAASRNILRRAIWVPRTTVRVVVGTGTTSEILVQNWKFTVWTTCKHGKPLMAFYVRIKESAAALAKFPFF